MGFAGGPAAPILVFRLAGYPLVLAAAKLISPQYYGQITALFQILLNILAMVIMVRVLAGLSFTTPPIVSAIGLYAFSDSLLFDNSLLSDSIYSSFFNIVVFALLGVIWSRAAACRLSAPRRSDCFGGFPHGSGIAVFI